MLLFLSILTPKNLNTMFCNCFNKFLYQIKVVATTKKSCQILNDEKL